MEYLHKKCLVWQLSSRYVEFLTKVFLVSRYISNHMTCEVTDCFLTMLVKAPALAELESENILEERPRMPMLSQGWISGVLKVGDI